MAYKVAESRRSKVAWIDEGLVDCQVSHEVSDVSFAHRMYSWEFGNAKSNFENVQCVHK